MKKYSSVLSVAFLTLFLHFYNNAITTYGYFRDELYYIACSDHLDYGYVDQPPLAVLFLWLNRQFFGDSIFSIRLFPSIAHALTVFLTANLSEKLGGKRFAQLLTAVCVSLAPGILGMFGIFSVNAFDIVLWQIVFYLLIRLTETQDPKYWLWTGLILGIGLMSKISMGWLGAGIAAGMILTPMRKWFKVPSPWIAAGIASIIFLPYIIWNIRHELAHLEFARNASVYKYALLDPATFLLGMIPNYNAAAVPVWLLGLWGLFKNEQKDLRFIFYAVITVLAILLLNGHSKTEYFNPAVVILFAAGAVQIEKLLRSSYRKMIGNAYLVIIVISGILTMPFAIDILPVNSFIQYSRMLGQKPFSSEGMKMRDLPQHFADRFGWEEMARSAATAFYSLTESERSKCVVYADNYGEASAINFFGGKYGLPKAISGHNSYWLWGCGKEDSEIYIVIGCSREEVQNVFDRVEQPVVHAHPYAMPYESDIPIFICRKLKLSISMMWEKMKDYN
jgi:hypothetical protein